MKRSEAPSHTNPSFKKKAKPDRLREVAVRMPPPQSKIVKILPTPLNAKQPTICCRLRLYSGDLDYEYVWPP